jgi:mannose-6-phosphate isomerase-like protein (cupin superfamily)
MSSLENEGREHDERLWENHTVFDDKAPNYRATRIVVLPDRRLNYQRHLKREER